MKNVAINTGIKDTPNCVARSRSNVVHVRVPGLSYDYEVFTVQS